MENSSPNAQEKRLRELVQLMQVALDSYDAGRVGLAVLVDDVLSLVDSLQEVAAPEWVDELRSLWWRLEVVNAVALDEERSSLREGEKADVTAAIEALRKKIESRAAR